MSLEFEVRRDALFPVIFYHNRFVVGWFKRLLPTQTVPSSADHELGSEMIRTLNILKDKNFSKVVERARRKKILFDNSALLPLR